MRCHPKIVALVALAGVLVTGSALAAPLAAPLAEPPAAPAAPPLVVTAAPTVPAPGGTVSIEAKPGDGVDPAAMRMIVDAVSQALTARGFTVFEDAGHAASTVELLASRADVGTGLTRVAGQRSPSIAGAGVAVPLGTGNSQEVPLRRTRLEMRFHRRGSTATVWDGTAITVREAGTAKGNDATVAADLSRALLGAYPVPPREVIGVP